MLATEAFRVLNALVTADQGSKSSDWWARGVALAAAAISFTSLAFTIGKEWWRGRRVRVTVGERSVGRSRVYEVEVSNKGGLPVYVIDWGYVYTAGRGLGRDRRWYEPGDTGIGGPQLPSSLPAGERLLLNTAADKVKAKAVEEIPKKRMRAYVVIANSTRRRYSSPIQIP
jgi:hypothetical protein